jgi:hypothetical protein
MSERKRASDCVGSIEVYESVEYQTLKQIKDIQLELLVETKALRHELSSFLKVLLRNSNG